MLTVQDGLKEASRLMLRPKLPNVRALARIAKLEGGGAGVRGDGAGCAGVGLGGLEAKEFVEGGFHMRFIMVTDSFVAEVFFRFAEDDFVRAAFFGKLFFMEPFDFILAVFLLAVLLAAPFARR